MPISPPSSWLTRKATERGEGSESNDWTDLSSKRFPNEVINGARGGGRRELCRREKFGGKISKFRSAQTNFRCGPVTTSQRPLSSLHFPKLQRCSGTMSTTNKEKDTEDDISLIGLVSKEISIMQRDDDDISLIGLMSEEISMMRHDDDEKSSRSGGSASCWDGFCECWGGAEAARMWGCATDPATGVTYYYDRLTRKSSWTKPEGFDEKAV